VARLKAGAHYTGFIKKKKRFFRAQSSVCLYGGGFDDIFDRENIVSPWPRRGKR